MNEMKLTPLSKYNRDGLNNHQIAMRGQVSYPTAVKYLQDKIEEPGIVYVARILNGMGVDWQSVTLGDLLTAVNGDA